MRVLVRLTFIILATALLAAAIPLTTRIADQALTQRENEAEIEEMRSLLARLPDEDVLRARAAKIEDNIIIIERLRQQPSVYAWLDVHRAAEAVPHLDLLTYRESGGYAYMQVVARDNANISELMRSLQRSPHITDVQMCFSKCPEWTTSVPGGLYGSEIGLKTRFAPVTRRWSL